MMLNHSVRSKVLIPLSLTFLVLILTFVFASYSIRQHEETTVVRQRYRNVQDVLTGLLSYNVMVLRSTAELIGGQESLQLAMKRRDVAALLAYSRPIAKRIARRLHITHFDYHDSHNRTVLRLFLPEGHESPSVAGSIMWRAIHSGRPVAGLELDSTGTFAQRLVFPWRVGGKLLGYIELGIDVTPVLAKIRRITKIELVAAVAKNKTDPGQWTETHLHHGAHFPWNFMPRKLISYASLKIPRQLAARIFNATPYGNIDSILHIKGRLYRGALLPIIAVGQKNIGDLLMLVDISNEKSAFQAFLLRTIIFSLVLCVALFIFAFQVLGRVGRQLRQGEDMLRQESASLAESNHWLQIEISERELAEQKLSSLNQRLEQRVAERTVELERKNSEIEISRKDLEKTYGELQEKQATILHQNKMAGIGQLAAGIVHDINNPVGFISHNLQIFARYHQRLGEFDALQKQLIMERADTGLREAWEDGRQRFKFDLVFRELAEMVSECREGTSRISQIVKNLSVFARVDAPERRLTDLRKCIDSTLIIIGHELRGKVRVNRDYGPIPLLYCHAERLNQVFMNLLINAAQAIEETGTIHIRTWAEADYVCVSITDTGAGIPAAKLAQIFEPFFTTKPVGAGTGLGLSIVYDIVASHNGEITVESEEGNGAVFTMRFPRVAAAASPPATAAPAAAEEGRGV